MDVNDLLVAFAHYIPAESVADILPDNTYTKTQNLIDADLLVKHLPEQAQKELIMWSHGYTAAEIAAAVAVSERTVWKHLSKSLNMLRSLTKQEVEQ